jgi:DNA-binding NarL/FixJ family response regulator
MSAESGKEATATRSFSALIADDHEFVRNWLRDELTRSFPGLSSVQVVSTPAEAVAKAISLKPDLIFLDIDFENDRSINGIEAAERIWKEHSEAAIIIVSSHKGEVYIKHLYKVTPANGSYGYILKDKVAKYLVEATNAVLSGDCWIDPEITQIVNRLQRSNLSLSDNEYVALVCAALGLSDTTSGRLLCLTEKAIQARLQLLYSKFGIPPKGHPDAGIFNPRCRAVWCGLQRGLINESELQAWAAEFSKKAKENGILVDM